MVKRVRIGNEMEVPKGWTLTYQEVSTNVYKVRIRADQGSLIEITSSNNLEDIIARCIESAREADKQI